VHSASESEVEGGKRDRDPKETARRKERTIGEYFQGYRSWGLTSAEINRIQTNAGCSRVLNLFALMASEKRGFHEAWSKYIAPAITGRAYRFRRQLRAMLRGSLKWFDRKGFLHLRSNRRKRVRVGGKQVGNMQCQQLLEFQSDNVVSE